MASTYKAPVSDMLLTMECIACWRSAASSQFSEVSADDLRSILEEAAKLSEQVIAPLNQPADRTPASWNAGRVVTPRGWKEAYRAWTEAGWNGISLPHEYGGMGMPTVFGAATMEMFTSACMAMATL